MDINKSVNVPTVVDILPGRKSSARHSNTDIQKGTPNVVTSIIDTPYTEVRDYNNVRELFWLVRNSAVYKAETPFFPCLIKSIFAGYFVATGGFLALATAGGLDASYRTAFPAIPKLFVGMFFGVALQMIIIFGAELFTGNCMYFTLGLLCRKVTVMQTVRNWLIVFIGNAIGAVVSAYFLGYLTEVFDHEPYKSYVISIAVAKATLPIYVIFLRAIPANACVCMAVIQTLASRQIGGRLYAMLVPVMAFATVGFEHSVANTFFIPIGMMYGANVTVGQMFVNWTFAILGNYVGGGLVVGAGLCTMAFAMAEMITYSYTAVLTQIGTSSPGAFVGLTYNQRDGVIIDLTLLNVQSGTYMAYVASDKDINSIWNPNHAADKCSKPAPKGLLIPKADVVSEDLQSYSFNYNNTDAFNPASPNFILGKTIVVAPIGTDPCSVTASSFLMSGVLGVAANSLPGIPCYPTAKYNTAFADFQSSYNAGTNVSGAAVFTKEGVKVQLSGLSPNSKVEFRIHEFGDLTGPNFFNIGSYLGGSARCPPQSAYGTAKVDMSGNVVTVLHNPRMKFNPANSDGLIGRSIAVHESVDDCSSNSFPKVIAAGVIGVSNLRTSTPTIANGPPQPISTPTPHSGNSTSSAMQLSFSKSVFFLISTVFLFNQ